MEEIVNKYGYILAVLLAVSEALPLIPQLKSNGILQGSISFLGKLATTFGIRK